MKRLNSVSSISISPVKQQKTKIFFTPKIDPFTKYIDFQKAYAKRIAQWDKEDQEEEMEMEDNQDMQDMKNKMQYQIYFHEMHDNPENMQDYLYDFTQDLNPFDDTLKDIEKHITEKNQRSLRHHFPDPNLIQHHEQHQDPKQFNRVPPISLSKNQTREFLETRAPKVKPPKQNVETPDYSNSLQQLFTEPPPLPPTYMENPSTRKRRKTHKPGTKQKDYSVALQQLFSEAPPLPQPYMESPAAHKQTHKHLSTTPEITPENAWEQLDAVNKRISDLLKKKDSTPTHKQNVIDKQISLLQATRAQLLPFLTTSNISFDAFSPFERGVYQNSGFIPLVSVDFKKVIGYINGKTIKDFSHTNESLSLPVYGPRGSVLGNLPIPYNDIVRFQQTPPQHRQVLFF